MDTLDNDMDETIEDKNGGEYQHPNTLTNQTPMFLTNIFYTGINFLHAYGWFVLAGVILLLVLRKHLLHYLSRYQQRREQEQDLHLYDMNEAFKRQQAMDAARRNLQDAYSQQTAKYAEEKKIRDEEKRNQKIADWERYKEGKGYRSKVKSPDDSDEHGLQSTSMNQQKKKPTTTYRRSDYNPLMGDMGGTSFRPPRSAGGRGSG